MSSGLDVQESSPSQTALSESSLYEKGLCDYVVNVADGCRHGCSFCYVRSMPSTWGDPGDKYADAGIDDPQEEWGSYTLYRDDVPRNAADDAQRLDRTGWQTTPRGQGVVGISFATDCYMDRRAADLTRQVVETLVGHDRPVRILTRNPKLLVDLHGEFYASLPSDLVTVGTSIPTLDAGEAGAIEPGAPPIEARFALADLEDTPTFVSMSPTYPTSDREELRDLLAEIRRSIDPEVVFHEPINPRAGSLEECLDAARDAGEDDLADALERVGSDTEAWQRYALGQLRDAQLAARDVGVPIHLWPDKRLATGAPSLEQRAWCTAWRLRPTPERIGEGPACTAQPPAPPEIGAGQTTFEEVSQP